MSLNSPFFEQLRARIKDCGGLYNAHLHLDRAGTLFTSSDNKLKLSNNSDYKLSLAEKHQQIEEIHHDSQFKEPNLRKRVNYYLDCMVTANTQRADTLVDVTNDGVGLSTLDCFIELKHQRQAEIDLRLGSYTPLGFKDSDPKRWELFVTGAKQADFIGALPERDDRNHYPDHIGYYAHCLRILELGLTLDKPIQIHLDQHNDPRENETEIFLRAVKELGYQPPSDGVPKIWAIHCISPAHYDQSRQKDLFEQLANLNIGVICCPSAALSMRQIRSIQAPIGNSIAPVLPMLTAGIRVLLGSDNIADICSPAGTPDLLDEVFVLANALRFYDVDVLARLAAGLPLNNNDIALITEHLEHDTQQIQQAKDDYQAPV